MRKMLLAAVIGFSFLTSCKKDSELPPVEFKFSVEANNEDFSDKGVNETVTLPFTLDAEYDFNKVPMKYKVESNKEGLFKNGTKNILPNDVYTLAKPELKLSYTGKQAGEHVVKVYFFNDNTKKATVTKEIKIKYIEHEYTIEQLVGKNSSYQGEDVNFEYKLTPKDESKRDGYTITFKSFDEADNKLEKTKILFEGRSIEFNKSYPIANISKLKILIKPFYAGAKALKYVIKNKTGQREGEINLEVKQNVFDVTGNLDKIPVGYAGEVVNFIGIVKKEPLYVKSLKYKTSIVQGTASGIETTNWRDVSYESNEIKIPIKILKNGGYQYKITFQDEFGNETSKTVAINSQANYRFRVNVEGRTNPLQGEEVTYKLKIVKEESRLYGEYRIILGKEIEGDDIARRSTITVSGTKVEGKENEYEVGDLNSYSFDEEYYTNVKIKSYSVGNKKLKYKVYRHVNGVAKEAVEGYIDFNVQKSEFRIEQEQIDKNQIRNVGEIITYTGKMIKSNTGGRTLKYKTVILEGDKTGVKTTRNNDWENIELPSNNIMKLPINIIKEGKYTYQIFFKDEFGNEAETDKFEISYRGNEKFKTTLLPDELNNKIKLGKPYSRNIKIQIENNKVHSPIVEYYIKFDDVKVSYNSRLYNKGEEIVVKNTENTKEIILNFNFVTDNANFNEYKRYSVFKGKIRNSDGEYDNIVVSGENFRYIKIKGMYLRYAFWAYTSEEKHGNGYYYFEESVNARIEEDRDIIDNSIDKNDIKFHFYLLSSKGYGWEKLQMIPSYRDLNTSSSTLEIYDRKMSDEWVRHNENKEKVRKHVGTMKIEVYYKDKKVYEIDNITNLEADEQRPVKYVEFPTNSPIYENYD